MTHPHPHPLPSVARYPYILRPMEVIILGLLAMVVAVLVLSPLFRPSWAGYDWEGRGPGEPASGIDPGIRQEVDRYRAALRAGTLCDRCGQANAEGSRFCGECGRPLASVRQPA